MQRSRLPYFFLALAAALAIAAVVLLILRWRELPEAATPPPGPPPALETAPEPPKEEMGDTTTTVPEKDPAEALRDLGIGASASDPGELVNRIAEALEKGDLAAVRRLIGRDALDPEAAARLEELAGGNFKLRQPGGIREVGELELNARTRWALELDGREPGRDRIFLDLRRNEDRSWAVEKLTLPPGPGEPIPKAVLADALGVADAFLQAVLRQDFEFARDFVDRETVSDAKIAGLCILFEEGGYELRKSKPLRAMFQQGDTVGFLANVVTADQSQAAQFTLALRQPPQPANWTVFEINLDQLLADYARRVAGGDVYYSPLVKNPAGGETIALYFEFDEDTMSPRTRRQLEIVSAILRADPGKRITLSGHTDSLGTEAYNNRLSANRAEVVRDFLVKAGVSENQIVTLAKGASQPRRPNVTETGEDNPEGRRANRRTEIYLDF